MSSSNSASAPRDYQAPSDLLTGRVILVTGAGDGLGRCAALSYAAHGATLILLGRTQKKLETVYDEILEKKFSEPLLMPVDLSKAGLPEYEQIAVAIDRQFGRLDGLLHSAAALGTLTPLELYDPQLWLQVMQVNLHAPWLLTRACLPVLKKAPTASVIFSSAEVARQGRAYWGAYAAAGAALENLVQVWIDELPIVNSIRMNTLDPGTIRSALRARAYPGENPATLASPASVMPVYLYLMGDDSRTVTGQSLRAQ